MKELGNSRIIFPIIFLFALHFTTSAAWFWPFTSPDPEEFKHEHVKSLTSDSFEAEVLKEDGRFYFIKFYANWCGHCKSLAPNWGQIAAENNDSNIGFMQVECSKNNKLCRKAAVKGFPDIKVFYNGRIGYSARGNIELEELRKFVKDAPQQVLEGYQKAMASESKQAPSEKTAGGTETSEL